MPSSHTDKYGHQVMDFLALESMLVTLLHLKESPTSRV